MKPEEQFLRQPKHFWAHVRTLSQQLGYTHRNTSQIKIPTISEITSGLHNLGLQTRHIVSENEQPTAFTQTLLAYFEYRANILNNFAQQHLMRVEQAQALFNELFEKLQPHCPLPKNKQKHEKQNYAFFSCIINMLIEANIGNMPCNYDPRALTTITVDGVPLRTLARRVDGAFPAIVNPIAVWEIKEYYYTTTFGSRVADGVYETLLDGLELEELREHEKIDVKHYMMVDDYNTWWNDGRSYLCRIVDMLHMGYVDEVIFGSEVLDRVPQLAREWVELARNRAIVR